VRIGAVLTRAGHVVALDDVVERQAQARLTGFKRRVRNVRRLQLVF
jgi:hypothetical protein